MPCPNITTNDVYYRRQLSIYSFNIHNLTTNEVFVYFYDETKGNKGADDVCSMLNDFFTTKIPAEIKIIHLFCDSCGGQNKNWTVFRYFHYAVHVLNRFEVLKVSFPIRGHSFLECDKDMGLVQQTTSTEIPSDWQTVIREARINPSPFMVVPMQNEDFKNYTEFLSSDYRATCLIGTRPIRELKFDLQQVLCFFDVIGRAISCLLM